MNALIYIFATFESLTPAFCDVILCNISILSILHQMTTLKYSLFATTESYGDFKRIPVCALAFLTERKYADVLAHRLQLQFSRALSSKLKNKTYRS